METDTKIARVKELIAKREEIDAELSQPLAGAPRERRSPRCSICGERRAPGEHLPVKTGRNSSAMTLKARLILGGLFSLRGHCTGLQQRKQRKSGGEALGRGALGQGDREKTKKTPAPIPATTEVQGGLQ